MAANKVPGVFDRLIGLETEYAIRFSPRNPTQPALSKYQLYEALQAEVARRVLTVPAKHIKEGVFTANGGAIWFEAERPSAGGGLIEGATPECRTPQELLAYQRAQDQLLAECSANADVPGQFRLIKNDRDAYDNIYGAQENYQATLAEGFSLFCWRLGLLLLFPLAVLTWASILISLLVTLTYFALAALFYLPIRAVSGGNRPLVMLLFGRDLVDGQQTFVHVPVWLETSIQFVTRVVTAPLALALYLLLHCFAFRRQRQQMLAFLASRSIFSGAGLIDSQGRFGLSDKAPAVNCTLGFGGMLYDRPIFSMGHFFKEIYAESWFSPKNYFSLFSRLQRLQLALGDSNMCQTAELLRVGATLLVLDAAESGALHDAPRLRRPLAALQAICADPTLSRQVPLRNGKSVSALDIQRYYLERCTRFLEAASDAPAEAWEVLQMWANTLESLQAISNGSESVESLLGSVDWITKKYLLDNAADDSSWLERKKIDICYHELSPDGYHQLLQDAACVPAWLTTDEVERAVRTPPPNSPATTRAQYIREFACSGTPVTANWKIVTLGSNWDARVIRIADYGHGPDRRPGWRRRAPTLHRE